MSEQEVTEKGQALMEDLTEDKVKAVREMETEVVVASISQEATLTPEETVTADPSIRRNRGFILFSIIQFLMLFIPTMETEMFRRSVFDVVKNLFINIGRFEFSGITRFYSEDLGLGDIRTLILLGILLIGLVVMILMFVAVIQFIRRKTKSYLKVIRLNQVFYMLLALASIGLSLITIMGYFDDTQAKSFQVIYSLLPIILLMCFNLAITIITLVKSIHVNKETFSIGVKRLFKNISIVGSLVTIVIVGILVLLLMNNTSLKMAYTYNGDYVERIVATYHNNGDIDVVRVVFLEDRHDYDEFEDTYDIVLDDKEDWLDEFDISADWDLKHGLFNRMTIEVNWEGVDENDEYFNRVFLGYAYGYNEFIKSTVAMYELTDDILDTEDFENQFMLGGIKIGFNDEMERSDYKDLEGMMRIYSFADYSVFESDLPVYEMPFRPDAHAIAITRHVIASEIETGLIVED